MLLKRGLISFFVREGFLKFPPSVSLDSAEILEGPPVKTGISSNPRTSCKKAAVCLTLFPFSPTSILDCYVPLMLLFSYPSREWFMWIALVANCDKYCHELHGMCTSARELHEFTKKPCLLTLNLFLTNFCDVSVSFLTSNYSPVMSLIVQCCRSAMKYFCSGTRNMQNDGFRLKILSWSV